MIFFTHVIFGLLIALIYSLNVSVDVSLFFAVMLFGAALPDIDIGTSFLGRWIWPLNTAFFKHRGFFHSVPFLIIWAFVMNHFFGADAAVAAILGVGSHLLLDMLTPSGLRIFWPVGIEIRGRFKSGGLFDMFLFIVIAAACFYIMHVTKFGLVNLS